MQVLTKDDDRDTGLHRVIFDFDGVLAKDTWPSPVVGETIPDGVELMKDYALMGYEICIYTARPESHKPLIWSWVDKEDLHDVVYDVICGKPSAWLYIDDRSWNPWA